MSTLLNNLKLPGALKELSSQQLEQVSREVREEIIRVVAEKGGHLSSSLGAVELCVALHATFDSPRDKICFDVGHQAYAHKILTGRLERFSTIRQYGGLSGFPNIDESPHDMFTVGHAGTSISSAIGLAHARDLKNDNFSVVAVTGDASLSTGLSSEAVNNVGGLKNFIVILNDNQMAISKNVGALAAQLTRIRTSDLYVDLRNRIEKLVKRVPKIGVPLFQAARKLKDRTKHIVIDFKVDVMFEEWGFKYFGPIDGHDIPMLMSTLHHAKDIDGPVLIHVLTKKGKGYGPAEKDPTLFHSAPPFDIKTGNPKKDDDPLSYTRVFGMTMDRLALENERVIGITAAMLDGTGLDKFALNHPKRFFDVGIAEEHAVTFAAGLSKEGFRPVVAVYSTFIQRAYDEIVHDVCLQNLPVIFALDRAGIVGLDGATHNGVFDLAFLRSIPNMIVMSPKDVNELQHMLYTAVNGDKPVSIRYPRNCGPEVELDKHFKKLEIGKGEIIAECAVPAGRQGTRNAELKACIIAIGDMTDQAIKAAKMLEEDGIASIVINARFVKPLDKELIVSEAKKADLVVTVEEGVLQGGFGSAVLELLANEKVTVPVKMIGIPDRFIEHGARSLMLEKLGLTAEGIYQRIKNAK